jgi:hypothetical protein
MEKHSYGTEVVEGRNNLEDRKQTAGEHLV